MDLTAEWVARTNGTYVSNRIEMQEAPKDMPLLGLFSISHMDFMADPGRDQDQPTLTQMTAEAINRLENNPNGYYLMVEEVELIMVTMLVARVTPWRKW